MTNETNEIIKVWKDTLEFIKGEFYNEIVKEIEIGNYQQISREEIFPFILMNLS